MGIEPTYSGFIVDQMRIELTTGALQVLLAPWIMLAHKECLPVVEIFPRVTQNLRYCFQV